MAVINKQMKTFNVPAGSDVKRYEIVDDAGRKMIAADWYENSGSAFASGAYIVKDGVVYEFTSNHAENTAWNANEVSATTITAKIAAIEADLEDKADKSATVSNVAYDTTNKKITKTVNGTTSDVVTAASLKTDMNLGNVDNTSDLNKPISTATQTALDAKISNSQKGAAGGVAELDSTGKVPANQLPGYVDDIVNGYLYNGAFYKDDQHTQLITPEDGKLYVELVTNKTYRWSGTAYVEVSESLALGETSSTAYRGDRGKAAYDHAVAKGAAFASGLYKITTNSEGHVTGATQADKSDIGLGNVDNTSDANKPVSTATQTALDAKISTSQKGAAGGVAELDANGKVPTSQLPASTDTKNTAGATNNASKKMLLVGAETQGANPQTYSNEDVYIGTDNELYSNGKKVAHNEDIPTVGAAAAKGVDTAITEGSTSTNLPTSAAVAAYVDEHGGGGDAVGSYYGESSTAAATQQKDVTVSGTAPTELAVGMVFNIKFTNAQTYAGKPTLKIGTLAAVSVDNGSAGMWGAGEVVCFVYDGTNFMATDTGIASTSGYGVTKLQDGTGSTATDLAATAKAVNTVHNEAVQVMTGATDQAAGTSGRVPAPAVGDKKKFLCGDGTWAEAEGGKLVVFELDTVTNSGGSYTHTTSIATVSHDMKAVLIETDDPSIFGATVHVTTADGSITLTCDEVNGTADVTVSCMFVANADPMTSSEFDVLSNRIGQLSALTTTDKSSVVNAINELNASLPKQIFTPTGLTSRTDINPPSSSGGAFVAPTSGYYMFYCNGQQLGLSAAPTQELAFFYSYGNFERTSSVYYLNQGDTLYIYYSGTVRILFYPG